jgi:hypothetical protein
MGKEGVAKRMEIGEVGHAGILSRNQVPGVSEVIGPEPKIVLKKHWAVENGEIFLSIKSIG